MKSYTLTVFGTKVKEFMFMTAKEIDTKDKALIAEKYSLTKGANENKIITELISKGRYTCKLND